MSATSSQRRAARRHRGKGRLAMLGALLVGVVVSSFVPGEPAAPAGEISQGPTAHGAADPAVLPGPQIEPAALTAPAEEREPAGSPALRFDRPVDVEARPARALRRLVL